MEHPGVLELASLKHKIFYSQENDSGREATASAYSKNIIKVVLHSGLVLLRFMKHLLLLPRLQHLYIILDLNAYSKTEQQQKPVTLKR